jgi:hypothetical protein
MTKHKKNEQPKQLEEAAKSIKSKLSFDDYSPSLPNDSVKLEHQNVKTEEHSDIKKSKKVKRTFYLDEKIVEQLDEFYVKKLSEKKQVDKSDIVAQALKNLLEDKDAEVGSY